MEFFQKSKDWLGGRAQSVRYGIDTGVGATVIGIWAAVWFSSGEPMIILPALVFGVIVGLLGIATTPDLKRGLKIVAAIALLIFSVADGGFIYWHTHPDILQRHQKNAGPPPPPAPKAKVLIECSGGVSPPVPSNGRLNVLPLFLTNIAHEGTAPTAPEEFFTSAPIGSRWDFTGNLNQIVYRCEVTNYDAVPLFSADLNLHLLFEKVVETGPTSMQNDGVVLEQNHIVRIPRLNVGAENPYVFYVFSMEPEFVTITLPNEITAQGLGESERRIVPLLEASSKQFSLWPHLPAKSKPVTPPQPVPHIPKALTISPETAPIVPAEASYQLTPEQERRFATEVANLRGPSDFAMISCAPNDSTTFRYAQSFARAFTRAGIQASVSLEAPTEPDETGVFVKTENLHKPSNTAQRLFGILKAIGVPVRYLASPIGGNVAAIYIGLPPT